MALKASDGSPVRVRLEVNPKARRLILRLDERKREAVAVAPSNKQVGEAAAFAAERVEWIANRLSDLPQSIPFIEGAMIELRGRDCRLTMTGEGRIARLHPGEDGTPDVLSAPGAPETFAARITRFLKKQARADLAVAVERHAARLGVVPARISVKDTRSRWGSCTSDGRLSFSWRLILAPPRVLDYVAAHECAHILEMNHSPAFWAEVSKCCPDWKHDRAWLRLHGNALQAVGTSA